VDGEDAGVIDAAAEGALDELASLRQTWLALPAPVELPTDDAAGLSGGFDRAAAGLEERRRRWEASEAARGRVEALSFEAESLAGTEDVPALARRWPALAAAWHRLEAETGGHADESAAARYTAARERVAARQADLERQAEQAIKDNLARLVQLCQHLEQRAGAEDLKLREADRGLKNIRAALESPPPLPASPDTDAVMERLRALQAALARSRDGLVSVEATPKAEVGSVVEILDTAKQRGARRVALLNR